MKQYFQIINWELHIFVNEIEISDVNWHFQDVNWHFQDINWHFQDALSHSHNMTQIYCTRVPGRVTPVEQELLTLHMSLSSVFNDVRATQYSVFCVVFSKTLFVFFLFFLKSHCIFCHSIYGFWLHLVSSNISD